LLSGKNLVGKSSELRANAGWIKGYLKFSKHLMQHSATTDRINHDDIGYVCRLIGYRSAAEQSGQRLSSQVSIPTRQ